MNKVFSFGQFQSKKSGNIIKETVIPFDDHYKVRVNIDIPFSLVNAYVKKIKDESGQDIKRMYSDMEIAEEIAKYVSTSYLNIENIPSDVLAPDKQNLVTNSQGQGQLQGQGQGQGQFQGQLDLDLDFGDQGQQIQGQGQQIQGQGQQLKGQGQQLQGQGFQSQGQQLQSQGQRIQNQGQQVQRTAQKINPQEI